MDAREVLTNTSWVGSDSLLVYAHGDSIDSNQTWSYGLSKSFGYVFNLTNIWHHSYA